MFEKKGTPLWWQIAVGVLVGNLLTIAVLFTMSVLMLRLGLEFSTNNLSQQLKAAQPAPQQARSVFRLDPPSPARELAPAPPKKDGCPAGATPGTLNNQPVCITSSGRVLTPGP